MSQSLIAGQKYHFTITKISSIDNETFLVLNCHFNNKKYLLPEKHYQNYNFEVNDDIVCNVDKINCAGEIFLEPEHPYFKEDNEYQFIILNNQPIKNIITETIDGVLIKDLRGNKHWIPNTKTTVANKEITLRIRKIKKGKLEFYLPDFLLYNNIIKLKEKYRFKRVNEYKVDNIRFLIMEDIYGKKHGINLKYYKHYNLTGKQHIECKVIKFNSENRFILEPEHPEYKIGVKYTFKIQSMDFEKKELSVIDIFRNKIIIDISEHIHITKEQKKIELYINNIKRGVPQLSFTNDVIE